MSSKPRSPRKKVGLKYRYRLVMEEALGRPLSPKEIVHHKNEDTLDDRLENLEVKAQGRHARDHLARGMVTCAGCGKEFQQPLRRRTRKYCSRTCANRSGG